MYVMCDLLFKTDFEGEWMDVSVRIQIGMVDKKSPHIQWIPFHRERKHGSYARSKSRGITRSSNTRQGVSS